MFGSLNPFRETWLHGSHIPGVTVVNGLATPTLPIAGPIAFLFGAGPGLVSALTFTFQGAIEDPANPGVPLASSWAGINRSGFCDGNTAAFSVVVDPTDPIYVRDGQVVKTGVLECGSLIPFVRSVASAAGTSAFLIFGGRARVQDQV